MRWQVRAGIVFAAGLALVAVATAVAVSSNSPVLSVLARFGAMVAMVGSAGLVHVIASRRRRR